MKAQLILENGQRFTGEMFGDIKNIAFNNMPSIHFAANIRFGVCSFRKSFGGLRRPPLCY